MQQKKQRYWITIMRSRNRMFSVAETRAFPREHQILHPRNHDPARASYKYDPSFSEQKKHLHLPWKSACMRCRSVILSTLIKVPVLRTQLTIAAIFFSKLTKL